MKEIPSTSYAPAEEGSPAMPKESEPLSPLQEGELKELLESLLPEPYWEARGVGVVPRSLWFLFAAAFLQRERRATIVVPDRNTLEELSSALARLFPEKRIVSLPAWDLHPYDTPSPHPGIVARIVQGLKEVEARTYEVLLVEAPLYATPLPLLPGQVQRTLVPHEELEERELKALGYRRVLEVQEPGEYALRGGVLDLWSPLEEYPLRADRNDLLLEELRLFDPVSQLSLRKANRYTLGICTLPLPPEEEGQERVRALLKEKGLGEPALLKELLPRIGAILAQEGGQGRLAWLLKVWEGTRLPEPDLVVAPESVGEALRSFEERTRMLAQELRERRIPYPDLPAPRLRSLRQTFTIHDPGKPPYRLSPLAPLRLPNPAMALTHFLEEARAQGYRVVLCGKAYPETLLSLQGAPSLPERAAPPGGTVAVSPPLFLPVGTKGHWDLHPARIRLLDVQLFFRTPAPRPQKARLRALDLGDLREGDLVVHREYGIGRYLGVKRLVVEGREMDTVELLYEEGDRLYLPVTRIHLITPYFAGLDEKEVRLDRLRGGEFRKRVERARADLLRFAGELLKLYAEREVISRPPLNPPGELSLAVEASFPYEETPDQLKILEEIEEDLRKEKPMDRLVVGDVGFGKTEIALRTAVRFIENGYQVALLAPTTILAAQHTYTFEERLRELPIRIATLTRFITGALERRILEEIRAGKTDLVIGTHRLLMPDVEFKRLGLLIVDEEHRFGVKHKEALKSLRKNLDILSLSATPIPRTLEIHLSGIRAISTLYTPPPRRLEVETRVVPLSPDLVKEAILREKQRGGQIFILYNRIEELPEKLQWLYTLVPNLRVAMIHGKMEAQEIRRVFDQFRKGELEALLATTIIESGLDFPRANTLIVPDAHRYGLAELYQLRGRVGRSHVRAFCYLCVPPEEPLSEGARLRLQALESFSHLGSGLQLALMDLEIRGAGELLGKKQSGHIRSLGFSTTLRLLEEVVSELQGSEVVHLQETELLGDYPPSLSPLWIPDPHERLRLYEKLFAVATPREAEEAVQELWDRYGTPPSPQDQEFLELIKLRPLLPLLKVRAARFQGNKLRLWIEESSPMDRQKLLLWLKEHLEARLTPEYLELTTSHKERMKGFTELLKDLITSTVPLSSPGALAPSLTG